MQALNQTVTINEVRDHRPAVICLHSSASSSRQWKSFSEYTDDYQIIAPDLIGYGTSHWRKERTYSMSREVQAVEQLIDHSNRPVHIIGHSFGGAVALLTALSRPKEIKSLVVYEPVLFPLLFASGNESARDIWLLQADIRRMVRQGNLKQAAEQFVDYWNMPGTFANLHDRSKENVVRSIAKVASEFGALISTPITETDLRPLTIPTLLLSGNQSPVATQDIVALLSDVLPRSTTILLEGLGHMGPVSHGEIVNNLIWSFIQKQP